MGERENRDIGVLHDLCKQFTQILLKAHDRGAIEQIPVVLEVASKRLRLELELEGEIKAGETDVDRDRLDPDPRQCQRRPLCRLSAEVDLKQRVVTRIPLGATVSTTFSNGRSWWA